MERPLPTPAEVAELAAEILATKFPHADAVFVAGSLMRDEGSRTSDIDLVVLYASLQQAYRESFLFKGVPVEAFVHDPETLSWFLDQDRREGHPALPGMLVEGALMGPRPDAAKVLKRYAQHMLASGPPPLTSQQLQQLCYAITDKLDDLEADRSTAELICDWRGPLPIARRTCSSGKRRVERCW